MPFYATGDVRIHYEEAGSGFPLLIIPGGGLNSAISFFTASAPFNPMEEFRRGYRCITSDLRNANDGQSSGPLEIDRPWDAYSDDQLGLMDHLGIKEFLVMGFCVGGPMIWNLLKRAPERIVAAVLAQPSGSRPELRDLFYENNMKSWGPPLAAHRPDITMAMVEKFLTRMYRTNPDFVFTVTRDFVRACQTPILILPDDVPAHPYAVAMESALLAPNAEVSFFPWKEPKERIPLALRQIRSFLRAHQPAAAAMPVVAGGTASPGVPDAARSELAPTGKLRAGMNLGNALFTSKDAATGELRGVSVDLMRELASRLGVPVEFVVHATPGDVADASDKGTWDVATLAIEQARAEKIAFSPAMTDIEATYAVRKDSLLRTIAQVDAAGIRIVAPDKAGYELYLTRTLRNAALIRTKSFRASIDLFNEGRADALAGLKPVLLESMGKLPGARLLEGKFMTVNHGLGTPRERRAAAEYLKAFVEEMVASGFIARAIERHGVKGLLAVK